MFNLREQPSQAAVNLLRCVNSQPLHHSWTILSCKFLWAAPQITMVFKMLFINRKNISQESALQPFDVRILVSLPTTVLVLTWECVVVCVCLHLLHAEDQRVCRVRMKWGHFSIIPRNCLELKHGLKVETKLEFMVRVGSWVMYNIIPHKDRDMRMCVNVCQ